MTIGLVAATTGAVVSSGVSVGFALIFRECHNISSSGERKAAPRPQNNAIGGNLREIADIFEICDFKDAVGPQISLGTNALN